MIWALIGALCIGLSLGLLGSGGSILTVPVLVYLVHHPEKQAIAESLAIVGGIALIGAIPYAFSRLVSWRHVIFFGLPGMLGAYFAAFGSVFVSGAVQLTIFAVVMLAASFLMLRQSAIEPPQSPLKSQHFMMIALNGAVVGAMTGFIGVGGGFMIVPALVLLGGLTMRLAVGTSLCIIAMNGIAGFLKHVDKLPQLGFAIDWQVVGLFLMVGVTGSFTGKMISASVNQMTLRRVFGVFLIAMGAYILIQQAVKLVN